MRAPPQAAKPPNTLPSPTISPTYDAVCSPMRERIIGVYKMESAMCRKERRGSARAIGKFVVPGGTLAF